MAYYSPPNNASNDNTMLSEMSPNEDSIYDYMASSSLLYSSRNVSPDRPNDDNEETLSLFDFEDSVFIDNDNKSTNNNNQINQTHQQQQNQQQHPPLPSVSNYYEFDSIQHQMHLGHEALLPPSDDDDDDDIDDEHDYYREDDELSQLSQFYDDEQNNINNNDNNNNNNHQNQNKNKNQQQIPSSQHSQESQVQITFEPIELSPTLNTVDYDAFPLSDPPLSPTPPLEFNENKNKNNNNKNNNDNHSQLTIPTHLVSNTKSTNNTSISAPSQQQQSQPQQSQQQQSQQTNLQHKNNKNDNNIRDISNKMVERQHHYHLSVVAASPQISPQQQQKQSNPS